MEISALGSFDRHVARCGRIATLAACLAVCQHVASAAAPAAPATSGPATSETVRPPVSATRALPRPGDELWVVSCRGLGCGSPQQAAMRMKYWKYEPRRWAAADRQSFLSAAPERTTSFFVVGNDYSHAETIETGWFAYGRLVRQAPEAAPLRFVIWSWPCDRIRGRRLNDAKVKLWRTPAASFYLAWLADQLPQETPISMSGSSYGARIIMGGLELLGGGDLGRYRLAPRADRRPRHVDAVLMGAALDNDDLLPRQPFGRSMSQINQLLVFTNHRDQALRFYRFLFGRRSRRIAMGVTGPVYRRDLGGERDKIVTREVSNHVGLSHGAKSYFETAATIKLMRPYLLNPPPESAAIEANR
ncbi:MAG TPA: hypothetical protein VMV10_19730 [Pirellulales bacterium]|nr:hypothetical protein [Pirellulales bacterium]